MRFVQEPRRHAIGTGYRNEEDRVGSYLCCIDFDRF
jgi:hypothetical protein